MRCPSFITHILSAHKNAKSKHASSSHGQQTVNDWPHWHQPPNRFEEGDAPVGSLCLQRVLAQASEFNPLEVPLAPDAEMSSSGLSPLALVALQAELEAESRMPVAPPR